VQRGLVSSSVANGRSPPMSQLHTYCDTALAVHLALLNELLSCLPAKTDHISLGFNASHSTHDVISQISAVTTTL